MVQLTCRGRSIVGQSGYRVACVVVETDFVELSLYFKCAFSYWAATVAVFQTS